MFIKSYFPLGDMVGYCFNQNRNFTLSKNCAIKDLIFKKSVLTGMASKLVFIFDGQCPFCNHFATLLELKSNLPELQLRNARDNPSELPNDYEMDINGAILLKDKEMLHGANAIYWICSHINEPSDRL